MKIRIRISPHGRLICDTVTDIASDVPAAKSTLNSEVAGKLDAAFALSSAEGLLLLAGLNAREIMPAEFLFWRDFARRFFQTLCQLDEDRLAKFTAGTAKSGRQTPLPPDDPAAAVTIAEAPPMHGLEYLTPGVLRTLWNELAKLVRRRGAEADGGLAMLMKLWNSRRLADAQPQ